MKLTAFEVRNYRSLQHLRLEGLGPFVVFYGENGSGKSNVLSAIQAAFQCLQWRLSGHLSAFSPSDEVRSPLSSEDVFRGSQADASISFQLTLETSVGTTLLEIEARRPPDSRLHFRINRQLAGEKALQRLGERIYHLIPAVRQSSRRQAGPADLDTLLAQGALEQALFVAQSHPDPERRRAFKQLKDLLSGPPLARPDFDPVQYKDGTFGLRENWDIDGSLDGPLELAGLGIAQAYLTLARIMLSGSSIIGVEEPEAHLHAPTTGRHLRVLLERLVKADNIPVNQIFIATHSNLFDLDPEGFFELKRDAQGATTAERRPLSELYGAHLYEPGPALAVLRDLLRYTDSDKPIFVGKDGAAITAEQMIDKLDRDDDDALQFLRAIHDAAVRTVRATAQREAKAK